MEIQWFMILWDSDEHLIKYCFIITVTIIWSLQETLKCSHCLMYQKISLTPHPWLLWFGSVFLRISSVFLTSPWCYWTFAWTCHILPPPQYIWSCPQNHWNIQRIKLQVRLKVAYTSLKELTPLISHQSRCTWGHPQFPPRLHMCRLPVFFGIYFFGQFYFRER